MTEASLFEDVTPSLPAAVLDALPDKEAQRRVFVEVRSTEHDGWSVGPRD